MKKAFVQYPNLRSTTEKYDPCFVHGRSPEPASLNCNECRVFLMSDRFLGDQFQRAGLTSGERKRWLKSEFST